MPGAQRVREAGVRHVLVQGDRVPDRAGEARPQVTPLLGEHRDPGDLTAFDALRFGSHATLRGDGAPGWLRTLVASAAACTGGAPQPSRWHAIILEIELDVQSTAVEMLLWNAP